MLNNASVFNAIQEYIKAFPELTSEEAIAIATFSETEDFDLNPWQKKDFSIWLNSSLTKLPKYRQDKNFYFSMPVPDIYDFLISKKLFNKTTFFAEKNFLFSEDYKINNLVFCCTKSQNGVKLKSGNVLFRSDTKFKIVNTTTSILDFPYRHNAKFESYKAEEFYLVMSETLEFPEEAEKVLSYSDFYKLYELFCDKSVVYLHLEEVV